jgi:hypothetical protein
MDEIHGVCLECRATITLPMPDVWETPEGKRFDAEDDPEDAEAMQLWLQTMPCPKCGHTQMRVTLPRQGKQRGI